ncbi:hypothetical protein [Gordonia phthalatica]|uniref:Lipoprotein n=1 Tax=Gordonia phthalatica TaxID=1136941 RepID=A0A0N9N945_9ACTN|nr:hypothetical protein [Gordonia phthalatica]ALG83517.1 hypothetical protein ACH46_02085 [Gordonia phthalatica]
MKTHAVIRWTTAVVAAALVVGGATACNSDTGTADTAGSSPPVVTVTETAPVTATSPATDTTPETVAPTESAAPTVTATRPVVTEQPTSEPSSTHPLADYYGYWRGHGRQLTLNPNGTATVVLADGAEDVENWTADWGSAGDGIRITLVTMTNRHGPPLGYSSGQSFTGSIQPSEEDGVTVLHMLNFGDWCSARFGNSRTCGA